MEVVTLVREAEVQLVQTASVVQAATKEVAPLIMQAQAGVVQAEGLRVVLEELPQEGMEAQTLLHQ